MFTPIGFFAPQGGLPSIVQSFNFFYDAGQSTTWDDQTGNGNNGTETVIGSGGSSSITHVAGATPYWEFLAPSPSSEQPYVSTGVAPGNLGSSTQFTLFSVFKDPRLDLNATLLYAQDSGTEQITLGTSRSDDEIFTNLRGSGVNRQLKSITAITENAWTMVVVQFDGTDYRMYVNNVHKDTDPTTTINISADFKIGIAVLNTTTVNNQDIAATGVMLGQSLSAQDRQDLYDYYNDIYTF